MELKDIRIFVYVSGVGKSYLCKQDDRFVDLDDFYVDSVNNTRPAFKKELFSGEFLSDKLLDIFKK